MMHCVHYSVSQLSTCHAQVGGIRKLAEMLSVHSHIRLLPSTTAAADDDDERNGADGNITDGKISSEMESQLLRTLATLCCVEESLLQLHEVILMHVLDLLHL